jgi:hypothetical protein
MVGSWRLAYIGGSLIIYVKPFVLNIYIDSRYQKKLGDCNIIIIYFQVQKGFLDPILFICGK